MLHPCRNVTVVLGFSTVPSSWDLMLIIILLEQVTQKNRGTEHIQKQAALLSLPFYSGEDAEYLLRKSHNPTFKEEKKKEPSVF